jgi:hypothetical protein
LKDASARPFDGVTTRLGGGGSITYVARAMEPRSQTSVPVEST